MEWYQYIFKILSHSFYWDEIWPKSNLVHACNIVLTSSSLQCKQLAFIKKDPPQRKEALATHFSSKYNG
jgi:hypothetical protein